MPRLSPGDPVALTTDHKDFGLPDDPDLVLRDVNGHTALVRGYTYGGDRTDYMVPVDELRPDVRGVKPPESLTETELGLLRMLVDEWPQWLSVRDVEDRIDAYLGESRQYETINDALGGFARKGWVDMQKRSDGRVGPNPRIYRLKR
jgi:hypothetical protein